MNRFSAQGGSIPMALMAAIVFGGLIVVLMGTTVTGQQKVRHDRDFQLAINGAEAGVNQAVSVISQLPSGDTTTTLSSSELPEAADDTLGDAVGFEWTATKDTPISWQINARGERNGVDRNVEALAVRDATFFVAAFADIGFVMRGDNEVRSYSAISTNTGNGAVGSNGAIQIKGTSSWVDILMLMGDTASCTGNRCEDRPIVGFNDPFDLDVIAENIQTAMDETCTDGFEVYNADIGPPLEGGNTYCFSSVTLGNHNTFPLTGNTSSSPVVILMTGNLTTGGQSSTNCAAGCSMADKPDSQALQIYSLGTEVSLGNQSEIAAAIAAPEATCTGSPSNAQLQIYGAIVCNDLTNQGSWDFHFDERLLDLGSGQFDVTEWREEVGGSSSWPAT